MANSLFRPIGLPQAFIKAIFTLVFVVHIASVVDALASTDTITSGGDNSRAGYQANHNMDPAVVASDQFGILWKQALPGKYRGATEQVFAQPLVYTPGDTQYVYLATTMNNIYKINAKGGGIVLARNLAVPFLEADLNGCTDINPLIGSTSTGVIDPNTNTWYFTIKTYEDQTDNVKGRLNGRYFIYAVDAETLKDKPGYPVSLEGLVARNNNRRMFLSGNQHQRPALLDVGRYIYAGFASHCVLYNYTGMVIGWEKSSGAIVETFTTEAGPEPNTVPGGGIWMSGGGLASDDAGSLWFGSGNGFASQLHGTPLSGRQPPSSLEEAAVHMRINDDGTLKVVDFFIPWEKEALDGADKDLGTSPLELLPNTFSCPNSKRLGVITGKSGKTYFLDMDNLGGYSMGTGGKSDAVPQVYQNKNSVYSGAGVYPLEGGYVYINVIQWPTVVFKFSCDSGGNAVFTPVAQSSENSAYILGVGHGTTTSLNGQPGTGLYWVTDVQGYGLRVYKAVPENGKLVTIKLLNLVGVTKFTRPVFGNGIAYIATGAGMLYAVGSPVNPPITCSGPYNFGSVVIGNSSIPKNISCQAKITTTVTGAGLTSPANFVLSGLPSLPVTILPGQNFTFEVKFKPSAPGPLSNEVLLNTTNGAAGFSTQTTVGLGGTGDSLNPLLAVEPNTVTFAGVTIGQDSGGETESFIILNRGDSILSISGYNFSVVREGGPLTTPNITAKGLQVGPFTFQGLPTSIPGKGQTTVNINFNPLTSGKFAVYLTIRSNGGNAVVDVIGKSETPPKALLEFQSVDGRSWVPFDNKTAFTFGNVLEQQTLLRKMRLSNIGGRNAGPLSITVSKIPIGSDGIIGAETAVDLAEGTSILPGESKDATLFCSVPRSQVNLDSYNDTATWTMNTDDPTFGKQVIKFFCRAVAEQVGPLKPNGDALYHYVGCARENNPTRQLKVQLWSRNDNNNGMCLDACSAASWTFAGTQYEKECWCGNIKPAVIDSDAQCNFNCAGAQNQTCGGNGLFHDRSYISLFANSDKLTNTSSPTTSQSTSTASSAPTGPVVNPGDSLFKSLGCWKEPPSRRALPNLVLAKDDLTIHACLAACPGSNYIGAEYGRECWCGSVLDSGSVQAPAADCNMQCAGNASEVCGGSSRLNLYTSVGTASTGVVSKTTTSVSSTQTAPTAVQTVGSYILLGCYSEASDQRALTGKAIFDDSMTIELCHDGCSSFTYFAVEYGRECYCGGKINSGSVLVPNQSDCNFPCPGNKTEICGAGNRLNMYQLRSTTSIASTTTSSGTTNSLITARTAINSSSSASSVVNTTFAGTSSVSTTTTTVSDATTTTSFTSINSTTTATISINTTTATTTSILSFPPSSRTRNRTRTSTRTRTRTLTATNITSSISAGSTTDTSVPMNTTTVATTGTSSFTSIPSTVDANSTAITPTFINTTTITTTGIISFPSSETVTPINGTILSPSSSTGISSTSSTSANTTSSSIAPTPPSTTSIASVVPTSTSTSPEAPPTTDPWAYLGCYTDHLDRALPLAFHSSPSMTPTECKTLCLHQNFPLAGVEFSRQCFCGTALRNSTLAAASTCNMPCAGNSSDTCGGAFRMSVWNYTDWNPTAVVESVGDYVSQGCWSDERGARALSKYSFSSGEMTAELCVGVCKGRGWSWAGVEYGEQCYCGDGLGSASVESPVGECGMLCKGNREEQIPVAKKNKTASPTLNGTHSENSSNLVIVYFNISVYSMAYLWDHDLNKPEECVYLAAPNSYLELWQFSDPKYNLVREGSLPDDKLLDKFLDQEGEHATPSPPEGCTLLGGQRLLIHKYGPHIGDRPYPFRDEEHMMKVWDKLKLPRVFFRAWNVTAGMCWAREHVSGDGDKFLHLVLSHPWSADSWGLATSYDAQTHITTHLLGYTPDSDPDHIFLHLRSAVDLAHHPLLVPVYIYAGCVSLIVGVGETARGKLLEIDSAIGLNKNAPVGLDEEIIKDLRGNFSKLNEELISAQAVISVAMGWRVFYPQVSKTLQRAIRIFESTATPRDLALGHEDIKDRLLTLDQEREYREALLSGSDSQIRLFISILYNFMAQKDNQVNISVARDSSRIASASKRDSSAMKTIAVLTLVFLPGTLVASVFSTNMFDFRSPNPEPIVSRKFWIYWAVTAPFTILVLAIWTAWYFWSEGRQRRQDRDLEVSMEALGEAVEEEEDKEEGEEGEDDMGGEGGPVSRRSTIGLSKRSSTLRSGGAGSSTVRSLTKRSSTIQSALVRPPTRRPSALRS